MVKNILQPLPGFGNLRSDLPASLALFIVAIPLCLGIAHASGAPLISGLLSGVIGGLVVGYFSNSNLSVSGPAAGLTSICLMSIGTLGSYQGLVTAVLLSGILQMTFGFIRLGFIANYIPSAVIKGMLAAIGLILIMKQFPHLVGYDSEAMGTEEFDLRKEDLEQASQDGHENTLSHLIHSFRHLNIAVMIIGLSSLAVLVFWDSTLGKKIKSVPGSLVAVLLATVGAALLESSGYSDLLGREHFVNVPALDFSNGVMATLTLPSFDYLNNPQFYRIAITIALVASLESLLSIEALEKLDPEKQRVNTNQELIAQGVGNTLCGLVGALPVTAVIVRGTVNISAGAKSKFSAMFHGLFILLSLFSYFKIK